MFGRRAAESPEIFALSHCAQWSAKLFGPELLFRSVSEPENSNLAFVRSYARPLFESGIKLLLRAAAARDGAELRKLAELIEEDFIDHRPKDPLAYLLQGISNGTIRLDYYGPNLLPKAQVLQDVLRRGYNFDIDVKTIRRRAVQLLGRSLPEDRRGSPKGKRSKPYNRARK